MRQLRRIFTAVLVLLGAIIIVPAFGGTVSAHHSNIEASVACSGTVSWKATSWATGPSGTNADILVTKTIGSSTTTITHGAFTNANNYQFSGTFTWPANTASMVISSKPIAAWGNGVVSNTGSSVTISKPANCPSQPGVTKSVSCVNTSPGNGSGTVVVTLTNDAGPYGSPVTFTVFPVDQTTGGTNYVVPSSTTTPVTFTGIADGARFVKILVVGPPQVDKTQNFTVDCDSPVPSVSKSASCVNGNGEVVVTLNNAGGEAVTFKVTNPTTLAVEDVTVNANSFKTRTFSGFADGTYTVTIKIGQADYSQTFTVDCDHPAPAASSTVVCANNDGSVTVTLSNTGTEAVVFQVTNPTTNVVENVSVGIGASTTRTYSGFNDGTNKVTITADGKDYSQTFSVKCDTAPSYSHTETCVNGDGKVDVTMKNDGDDVNAIFILQNVTYTLAPGVTQVVTIGPLADGPYTIPLFVNGADKKFSIVVDCDRPGQPAVEISTSCVNEDGQVIVTLKNIGGQLPIVFTVQGTNYTVPANSNLPVTVSGVLDGPGQVITIKQGTTDFSKPVDFSCDKAPTVDRTQTCVEGTGGVANGQVVVTLHNNGDDVPMTFTVNGTVYPPVAPKGFTNVTVGGLADGLNHITVTAPGYDLSFDITVACDHPGEGTATVVSACVNADGQLTITLIATGGEKPIDFTVQGVHYSVAPNTQLPVVLSGLLDGSQLIEVHAGTKDLSFTAPTKCDLAPTSSYVQACANFDDTVTVTISNPGDDVDVTFVVNGAPYTLHPGETLPVVVGPLADGLNTITLVINNVPKPDIVVRSDCNPTFAVTAVCNSGTGEGASHWFTITNTKSTDVTVNYNGGSGSVTVPAGQSATISTTATTLVLTHNGETLATANASGTACEKTVIFTKELVGAPATGETYTIRVSRLVGAAYVEVTSFSINAGESKTIHLPSTMDPAGIDYKFEETVAGSASTTLVSPDQLNLSGNLGETISVVVTNGYASVHIDKASSTPTVVPGGQITYTLQSTNTGGLTLSPVVVTDRLASSIALVSASVAGGAGQCELTEATRPQLLTCTMSDALAPGAQTAVITVVVDVDSTVLAGTSILNQAMVHGAYASDAVMSGIGTGDSSLSCIPVRASTVCDLSAQVSVPVSEPIVASSPPVPTVGSDAVVVELPRTGASHIKEMLAIAFGGILLGGAMLIGRRRIGVR
jgi:uncharacterized repeat protein (TIGR01451 family)